MASDNTTSRVDNLENQDQSIKARKVQLFDDGKGEEVVEVRRPFSYYLNKTPAAPLSAATKASLVAVGALVILLLLGALILGPHRPRKRQTALSPAPATRAPV